MSLASDKDQSRLEQLMIDFALKNKIPMLEQSPTQSEAPVYAAAIAVLTSEDRRSEQTQHHVGYVYGVHKRDGIFIARQALLSPDGRPYLNRKVHNGSYIKPCNLFVSESDIAYEQLVRLNLAFVLGSEHLPLNLEESLKIAGSFKRVKKFQLESRLEMLHIHPHAYNCPDYPALEIAIVNEEDKTSHSHVGFVFGVHERSIYLARDAVLKGESDFTTHQRGGFLRLDYIQDYTVLQDLR